ncbi:hypothetical protein [Anaerosporobacter faecicola]|uniref:hypothetical protein n=1 Tax=Anaerosporobacter faecicola TaxID=2718714 RepID=UPI00143CC08B|nr:hypothetical protein [Anaerosporobacter faecicola]
MKTSPSKRQKNAYNDDTIVVAESDTYCSKEILGKPDTLTLTDFTGCITMLTLYIQEDTSYTLTYSQDVTKGKGKLVLIAPDDTVQILPKAGSPYDTFLSKGTYRVKFVGTHTNATVTIAAERSENK